MSMISNAWEADNQSAGAHYPPHQSAREAIPQFGAPIKEHPDEQNQLKSSQRTYNPNMPRDDLSVRWQNDSLNTSLDEGRDPLTKAQTDVHRTHSPRSLNRQDSLRTDPGYGNDANCPVPPIGQINPTRSAAHPLSSNFPSAHSHGVQGDPFATNISTVRQNTAQISLGSQGPGSNPLAPPLGGSTAHALSPPPGGSSAHPLSPPPEGSSVHRLPSAASGGYVDMYPAFGKVILKYFHEIKGYKLRVRYEPSQSDQATLVKAQNTSKAAADEEEFKQARKARHWPIKVVTTIVKFWKEQRENRKAKLFKFCQALSKKDVVYNMVRVVKEAMERIEKRKSSSMQQNILNVLQKGQSPQKKISLTPEDDKIDSNSAIFFLCRHLSFKYNFVLQLLKQYVEGKEKQLKKQ